MFYSFEFRFVAILELCFTHPCICTSLSIMLFYGVFKSVFKEIILLYFTVFKIIFDGLGE